MKRTLMLALVLPILGFVQPRQDDKDPAEIYASKLNKIYKELGRKHAANGSYCASKKQHAWAHAEYQKSMNFDPDNPRTRKKLGFKKVEGEWVRNPDLKVETVNKLDEDDAYDVGIKLNKKLTDMGVTIGRKYADAAKYAGKKDMPDKAKACWRLALEYDPNNKNARKHFGFEMDKESGEWRTPKYTEMFKAMREAVGKAGKGAETSAETDVSTKTGIKTAKRACDHFVLESSVYKQDRLTTLAQHAEAAFAMFHRLMSLDGESVLGPTKPLMVYYKVKAEHERFVDAYISDARANKEFKKSSGLHVGDIHQTYQTTRGEGVVNDFTIHSAMHSLMAHRTRGRRAWLQEGMAYIMTFAVLGTAANHCSSIGETAVKGRSKNFKDGSKWRSITRDMVTEMTDPDINSVLKAKMSELTGDKTIKAWSILDFMIHDHYDKFLELIERLSKDRTDEGEKAIQEVFEWSLQDLDDRWRAYVRSTY